MSNAAAAIATAAADNATTATDNATTPTPMPPTQRKATAALAAIFALRMLGLFLLLPVLAPHAAQLGAATPFMIGLALGIYGLTQGALQLPFGAASDRFGRKPVITVGLLIFALGSLLAAAADTITTLIIGRAIQGAGAISAAVLALAADLTSDTHRTTAMAIIGIGIGGVFILSLILAPPLANTLGVDGIFHLTAALAAIAIAILWWVVPSTADRADGGIAGGGLAVGDDRTTDASLATKTTPHQPFLTLLTSPALQRQNLGIFLLHMCLTALFVVLPDHLRTHTGLPLAAHWQVYAPVLALSVIGMLPLLHLARRHPQPTLRIAVALLLTATVSLAITTTTATATATAVIPTLLLSLCLFFIAFNTLEAMLPSQVSRLAAPATKGAAIGVFTTCQFLGMFTGGILAGGLASLTNTSSVYWLCAAAAALWLAAIGTGRRRKA